MKAAVPSVGCRQAAYKSIGACSVMILVDAKASVKEVQLAAWTSAAIIGLRV